MNMSNIHKKTSFVWQTRQLSFLRCTVRAYLGNVASWLCVLFLRYDPVVRIRYQMIVLIFSDTQQCI